MTNSRKASTAIAGVLNLALLTAVAACGASGQVPERVPGDVLYGAKVNGQVELGEFVSLGRAGDWDQLKALMGPPVSEQWEETYVADEYLISWEDVEAYYSDLSSWDMDLMELKLTGPGAFLVFGTDTIRVGDPISRLGSIFPVAYQQRGDDCGGDTSEVSAHPCEHSAIVAWEGGYSGINFVYHPSTYLLEEIRFSRPN